MRVLGVVALFVAAAIAAAYAVEALAPDLSPLARSAVMAPVYAGGGLCVRAAAVRRRQERRRRKVS